MQIAKELIPVQREALSYLGSGAGLFTSTKLLRELTPEDLIYHKISTPFSPQETKGLLLIAADVIEQLAANYISLGSHKWQMLRQSLSPTSDQGTTTPKQPDGGQSER